MYKFHSIAVLRGDGLQPKLRGLLNVWQPTSKPLSSMPTSAQ
jgi:hypothetical protein